MAEAFQKSFGIFETIDDLLVSDKDPEVFFNQLLSFQCRTSKAAAGAVLNHLPAEKAQIIAVHPSELKNGPAPLWLAQAEKRTEKWSGSAAAIEKISSQSDYYGQPPSRLIALLPFEYSSQTLIIFSFLFEAKNPDDIREQVEQLELSLLILRIKDIQNRADNHKGNDENLYLAMETLAAVQKQDRFMASAMALCNEVAARWQCDRVNLGFLKGRYVHLRAMSHTEKFSRKMQLVSRIEAAMEECIDQDIEIVYQGPGQVTSQASDDIVSSPVEAISVIRASRELSRNHGQTVVASFPIRDKDLPEAVLTLERTNENPFSESEITSVRLALELCSPHLFQLEKTDRWIGARFLVFLKKQAAVAVGAEHTGKKLLGILLFVSIMVLVFGSAMDKAQAPFVLKATEWRTIPAPFDGYLADVSVMPGDPVLKDETLLARIDTAELFLKLAELKAERLSQLKQAAAELRDRNMANRQIAEARAEKTKARIDLFETWIRQADIKAPINGNIISGDLKRKVGAPAKQGETLFEIANLQSLYAELFVSEDRITDIAPGRSGELATASLPEERVKFIVERINPAAEVVNNNNVFKVRVKLMSRYSWMRPGMEGIAKVDIERRSLGRIMTRSFVNWLRMVLWW